MVSVILPTYNEAENMQLIIPRLHGALHDNGLKGEIIVVDDDSPDGTAKAALRFAGRFPVKVHVRKKGRGLSKSVIKGFQLAEGGICVVMDADLSHPAEKVPAMVKPILEDRCDAVVGSRYIPGGGFESLPLPRKIISKLAGILAKGVTTLSDPTSGFMAIRKDMINSEKLDSLGWKIVLEVVVKSNLRIQEIPIIFANRKLGRSKLGFKTQIEYIRHLWRLYDYKYPGILQFIKFCMVGMSGLLIDTAVLVGLVEIRSFDPRLAAIFAFLAAVTWNYVFDRIWTFDMGIRTKISYSYISFVIICIIGLGIRISMMHLGIAYAGMGESPWYVLASFLGIVAATIFNFFGSKYIAFSRFFEKIRKSSC
ncbi:MAG: glycosyltransferase family 2 protein [Pseudomonadota bacterium]